MVILLSWNTVAKSTQLYCIHQRMSIQIRTLCDILHTVRIDILHYKTWQNRCKVAVENTVIGIYPRAIYIYRDIYAQTMHGNEHKDELNTVCTERLHNSWQYALNRGMKCSESDLAPKPNLTSCRSGFRQRLGAWILGWGGVGGRLCCQTRWYTAGGERLRMTVRGASPSGPSNSPSRRPVHKIEISKQTILSKWSLLKIKHYSWIFITYVVEFSSSFGFYRDTFGLQTNVNGEIVNRYSLA
jgi:hypothetical protein